MRGGGTEEVDGGGREDGQGRKDGRLYLILFHQEVAKKGGSGFEVEVGVVAVQLDHLVGSESARVRIGG